MRMLQLVIPQQILNGYLHSILFVQMLELFLVIYYQDIMQVIFYQIQYLVFHSVRDLLMLMVWHILMLLINGVIFIYNQELV